MENLINNEVAVVRMCMDGNNPNTNDIKYTKKALNRVVKILYDFGDDVYLTDFFMPEFINDKNDYCHYGFLIINEYTFRRLR